MPAIKKTYPVTGMSCATCALSVEKILNALDEVNSAQVNFASSSVLIDFDPNKIKAAQFQKALHDGGYDLYTGSNGNTDNIEKQKQQALTRLRTQTIGAMLLTIPVTMIGMFFMNMPYANWIMAGLTTPVVLIFGQRFFISAYKNLMLGNTNMDSLVAISTGIAYLFSLFNTIYPEFWINNGLVAHVYFEAAAAIISFILLGKLLEEKAKSNTSSAIKKLMGLQPKTVTLLKPDKSESIINIKDVKIGNLLRVKPGEKIAVDGVVFEGQSFIDESMMSGESVAVEISPGRKIFAGTLNQLGSFTFMAQKVGDQTVLAQIIAMVQQAQGTKAPVQKLVDKIAGIFVPIVITLSILTFMSWMILGGEQAINHALMSAVTVLIIACPCALGLATPTAIMVGMGKGAEHHILIKDAESLEIAHKVNTVILDKTGTITEGKPSVTDLIWLQQDSFDNTFDNTPDNTLDHELASVLFTMESRSEHPLASAVVEYLRYQNVTTIEIENFNAVTGKGVRSEVDGKNYYFGNQALLNQHNIIIDYKLQQQVEQLQSQAKTVVYFACNSNIVAICAIADKIKPSSKQAITTLKNLGINVEMLSGDNPQTAAAVAKQVGIEKFQAGILPSGKADYVLALQQQGNVVAMVGDGINDSHALAQADLSIAMGKGSDIALDIASMVLISSDLNVIAKAMQLSRQTVRTIRQNLFWAFIYNLIGIPIAAGVLYSFNGFLLNPMIAAAAMAFSSISVVLNSLRLKRHALD